MGDAQGVTKGKVPALRLRLAGPAQAAVRSGHPWVFADSVTLQNREGARGELAVIYDRNDRFLAVGLYDPDSPLRVRVLHAGKPRKIDLTWWKENLARALRRRSVVADDFTNGYRCINGESDHWPGLVLDKYAGTYVLKLYTAAWLPHLPEIGRLVVEDLKPERLVLRLSRNIQQIASGQFRCEDGMVLHGPEIREPVVFLETGLRFEAEVIKGQKTGFFLDQRENRRRVEKLAGGRDVLNAFSFSGAFSLYAARGGAQSVVEVDLSPHALSSARRNFALNNGVSSVRACVHSQAQADVFDWLRTKRTSDFDFIILDPPSLAKRESERDRALKAYGSLVKAAVNRLRRDGILLACSCSAHVSSEQFFQEVIHAAKTVQKKFVVLERTFHAPDHLAAFREAEYLKGIYLQF